MAKYIKQKEKYMDMYKNEVINIDELKLYTKELNERIQRLKTILSVYNDCKKINVGLEKVIDDYFEKIEEVIGNNVLENQLLKQVINKIIIFPDGAVKVYLKIDGKNKLTLGIPLDVIEIPMEETVPLTNHSTQRRYRKVIADKACSG